jgi:type I restriction-modification system DNA methylase subunit
MADAIKEQERAELHRVIWSIANDLRGSVDGWDFKQYVLGNKLGSTVAQRNARLVKLLNGIGDMRLGDYGGNTIDLFGDAYEYLMQMYASNAGKSGGEYYTPQEVSELLTRLTIVDKTEVNKVYEIITSSLIQIKNSSALLIQGCAKLKRGVQLLAA